MSFWYLASPYSHPMAFVRDRRATRALEYVAALIAGGTIVYSPIHAFHEVAMMRALPKDADWWWETNLAFLRPATGIIVAQMTGWRESNGVRMELQFARREGKPIRYASLRAGVCHLSEVPELCDT